ncbi:hypothetical protein FXO38_03068 [Capsicum annuum]|nr:hypothetical protein FXO37_11402 [Capsicum annuum]KAF3678760.1 hypothetical protein FXO38_03068 [Capsicum annuum]
MNLYITDIARILHIYSGGWSHYIKGNWPPLDNLTSALEICRKFSGNPHLMHHRRVFKREISPLHQVYFNVVHKMIIPRKERKNVASFLDLTLMELLDTEVRIDLPRLILKHMQRVLIKEQNGHALPYEFWLTPILEEFRVPIQVWSSQTVKDIIGSVNHMMLLGSMRNVDYPMQRLRNVLAAKASLPNYGTLNDAATKKYDLEGWFPASSTYREFVSCSNCTDYQSRKLKTQFGHKREEKVKQYVHLLNSTLTATERTMCCILENYQREDGVEIPEVLRPSMGGTTFIPFQATPALEDKESKSKR